MNKRLRDSISVGASMLAADADACVLPADRVRQRQLNEAARVLDAAPAMIDALRALIPIADEVYDRGPEGEGWKSEELIATIAAARAALAKVGEKA